MSLKIHGYYIINQEIIEVKVQDRMKKQNEYVKCMEKRLSAGSGRCFLSGSVVILIMALDGLIISIY